jgi:hypothetical protein
MAPPSIVLGKRTVWNENTVNSVPTLPNLFPLYSEPKASIPSSITGIPNSFPMEFIAAISPIYPQK